MMQNKFTLLLLLLATAFRLQAQDYSRCMASPDPVTILQPDGTILTVTAKGNIDVNYAETSDGYTIIKNAAGVYEYATQTPDGNLLPSGIKAGEINTLNSAEKIFLQTQPRNLRYSEEKIQQILSKKQARHKKNIEPEENDKSVTASFPAKGKRKVLMILIQYPDLKSSHAKSDFERMMNEEDYKRIGSYRDFYIRNSFGKLDLQTDVFGWYTADESYKNYANNNPEGMAASRRLVAKALDAAEAEGVDFSQYDNDKDGQVDGVLIVHAGAGAEEGSQNQYIWSHRWNLGGYQRYFDGVTIDNYAINPEIRGGINARMVGIGVFCHEFGHLLGLPDLYDINYKSEGVGNWSVMAGGNWLNNENTPAGFCAFSRTYLKWIIPVTLKDEGYYTLKAAARDSIIYKIETPVPHEYFLLENRQLTGFDAKLNGSGLAVWHINDSVVNKTMWNNAVNANVNKKGVDLEEADGRDDLDKSRNRGDKGDLFPGSSKNYSFDDDSKPNARNYNGNKSNIHIIDITVLPDSSVRFGYSAMPKISFSAPAIVCQNELVSFQNTSVHASTFTWIFNDGRTDTVKNSAHKFSRPGEYYVRLDGTSLAGVEARDSSKITVVENAISGFTIEGKAKNIALNNISANAVNSILFWGDGTSTSQSERGKTVMHSYKDTGTYNVMLVCFSPGGCSDTSETTIRLPIILPGDPISLKAYPNPFRDKLNINFEAGEKGIVKIQLFNMLGQTVLETTAGNFETGVHHLEFGLNESFLPPGIYRLKLWLNNSSEVIQLLKR